MSGGSYNYLCHCDAEDIFAKTKDIQDMASRLSELGYVDAATETESILLVRNNYVSRMQARLNRLTPIWKAVEWYDSGDWGKESIEEEVNKYREETK